MFRRTEWGNPTLFPIHMFLFLKAYLVMYFSLCISVFCSMYVCTLCLWLVTAETWRRYLIFWNWCYEWLPAALLVVGTEPTSPWRAASACLQKYRPQAFMFIGPTFLFIPFMFFCPSFSFLPNYSARFYWLQPSLVLCIWKQPFTTFSREVPIK